VPSFAGHRSQATTGGSDFFMKAPSRRLKLLSVKRRPGDLVWLRYQVTR
jgi:hypothetical protein